MKRLESPHAASDNVASWNFQSKKGVKERARLTGGTFCPSTEASVSEQL